MCYQPLAQALPLEGLQCVSKHYGVALGDQERQQQALAVGYPAVAVSDLALYPVDGFLLAHVLFACVVEPHIDEGLDLMLLHGTQDSSTRELVGMLHEQVFFFRYLRLGRVAHLLLPLHAVRLVVLRARLLAL